MLSIMFGILASVLPNLLFYWLYISRQAKTPKQFVRTVFFNEGIKFAAFALLFSAFLQWPGLQVVHFFAAFLLSELVRFFYQFFKFTRATD